METGLKYGHSINTGLLAVVLIVTSCTSNDTEPRVCKQNNTELELVSKTDLQSCANDGIIEVRLLGGSGTNEFSINSETFQASPVFAGLSAGAHIIIGRDVNQCADTLQVVIENFSSNLTAGATTTSDTECLSGNGFIEVTPSGGEPPYQFGLGNATLGSSNIFSGLSHGLYSIRVVDNADCTFQLSANVARGITNVSWVNDVKPIIDTRCAKPVCHVPGTGRLDLTKFSNVQANAGVIKTKTQDRSMPFDEPLSQSQIDLIACWVDDGAGNN